MPKKARADERGLTDEAFVQPISGEATPTVSSAAIRASPLPVPMDLDSRGASSLTPGEVSPVLVPTAGPSSPEGASPNPPPIIASAALLLVPGPSYAITTYPSGPNRLSSNPATAPSSAHTNADPSRCACIPTPIDGSTATGPPVSDAVLSTAPPPPCPSKLSSPACQ
jgi:hypothetical protein